MFDLFKKNKAGAGPRQTQIRLPPAGGNADARWRDRTVEHTKAERLRRDANERVETILDSITDRFFALDREWRFTYFNKHAKEFWKSLGRNPANLIGKMYWEEFLIRYTEEAAQRAMSQRVAVTHKFYFPPLKQWIDGLSEPAKTKTRQARS